PQESHSRDVRMQRCMVRIGARIVDAMQALDAAAVGIALVVDEQQRLVGTMTDGDIRRALLKGATLQSPLEPYAHRDYLAVSSQVGRAEVLDLMRARSLGQVPVVDASRRLVGLHLMQEMLGAVERPNWAVIMAGGKGTRLLPITAHLPKPMIKVAGRPIIERLLLHLVGYGIRRIFISTNYLGHIVEEHFGNGSRFGCNIEYLREEEPLGTGGALSLLREAPAQPLLLLNGDLVTQANLDSMLAFHLERGNIATMGARCYMHQIPFGCIAADGGRMLRLEEKPVIERLINAGIYVLSPEVVARVPRKFFPITELFEGCLERNERVGVFEIEEDWADVGHRDQLKQAQEGGG
ncbi:MAG: nucleotidyltransferase family protein, partial [Planctomycetota bacterium]